MSSSIPRLSHESMKKLIVAVCALKDHEEREVSLQLADVFTPDMLRQIVDFAREEVALNETTQRRK